MSEYQLKKGTFESRDKAYLCWTQQVGRYRMLSKFEEVTVTKASKTKTWVLLENGEQYEVLNKHTLHDSYLFIVTYCPHNKEILDNLFSCTDRAIQKKEKELEERINQSKEQQKESIRVYEEWFPPIETDTELAKSRIRLADDSLLYTKILENEQTGVLCDSSQRSYVMVVVHLFLEEVFSFSENSKKKILKAAITTKGSYFPGSWCVKSTVDATDYHMEQMNSYSDSLNLLKAILAEEYSKLLKYR